MGCSTIEDAPGNASCELETVGEVLEVMKRKEEEVYSRNYKLEDLELVWRKILLDWMIYVVDHCNLQRSAVAAAAFFLDVAMGEKLISSREEHQLAAASALQLALKLYDSTVIRIEKLVALGRGLFTVQDVADMEFKILKALNFQVHPPSAFCFVQQYERLLPSSLSDPTRRMIREVTKVVAELTVVDHKYNRHPKSVIAHATMLMAMELLDSDAFPISQRQCFVMNMSTVSQLKSNSPQILEVFEEIKQTLDESSKLEGLMESLDLVQAENRPEPKEKLAKSSSFSAKNLSPRDVMGRIGSYISNTSWNALRERSSWPIVR